MPVRLLLLLLLPLVAVAQNASLQGTVVNAADGQPLAGVHIRIAPAPDPDAVGGDVYGAMSDRAGHFSMTNLSPGAYFTFSERTGFVSEHSGSVALKPGENITGFKIEMTRRAALSGRVVDQYGDPIRYVSIRIDPVAKSASPFVDRDTIFTSTDDRGEFRLTGRPGRYYIEASPRNGAGLTETRTDGTFPTSYVATYFPDTPTKDHATPVEAKAGDEVRGIEIRMSSARSLTISGQVMGIPAGSMRPMVSILYHDGNDGRSFNTSSGVSTDAQGRFTFGALQPRTYTLFASLSGGEKTALLSQVQKIQLDNADATGITLTLAPPGEITGTVEIPGVKPGTRSPLPNKLTSPSAPSTFRFTTCESIRQ